MKYRILLFISLFVAFFAGTMNEVEALEIETPDVEVIFSNADQGIIIQGVDSNAVGIQLEFSLKEGTFSSNSYRRDDDKTSFMKIIDSTTASIYVATEVDLRVGDVIFVGLLDLDEGMVVDTDARLTVIDFILHKKIYESIKVSTIEDPVISDDILNDLNGTLDNGNDTYVFAEQDNSTASTDPVEPVIPQIESNESVPLWDWMDGLVEYLNSQGSVGVSIHIISLIVAFVCFSVTVYKVFKEK